MGKVAVNTAPSGRSLLPGEYVITRHGVISVTNYRVQMDSDEGSSSHYTSMTLDAVASCAVTTESQPALAVLAVLCAMGAAASFVENEQAVAIMLVVGVIIFIAMYFGSRRTTLSVSAHSGDRIAVSLGDLKREPMIQLLDTIEEAKLASIGRLESSQP